jgi:hypothetical protein
MSKSKHEEFFAASQAADRAARKEIAAILGRLAKGVPKTITADERKRRQNWMKQLNKNRAAMAQENKEK